MTDYREGEKGEGVEGEGFSASIEYANDALVIYPFSNDFVGYIVFFLFFFFS